MTDMLDAAERLGRGELEALQRERLLSTLHHAYTRVPFYGRPSTGPGCGPRTAPRSRIWPGSRSP